MSINPTILEKIKKDVLENCACFGLLFKSTSEDNGSFVHAPISVLPSIVSTIKYKIAVK